MREKHASHALAFDKWFVRYEIERKKKHISAGRNVPGMPPAPPGPDEIRRIIHDSINPLTERLAAEICGVHRTTIGRWLDGSVQIPACSYALLRFHAEGVPPGCGDAWRGFSWQSDALICPDGKTRLTAREIDGQAHQRAYVSSLEAKILDLERKLIESTQQNGTGGAANDPFTAPHDPRSRAFGA